MKNFKKLSSSEMQSINGGGGGVILGAIATILIGIITIGPSIYNGYKDAERDCEETCGGGN